MITAPGRTRQRRAWHIATRELSDTTVQRTETPVLADSTKSMSSLRITIGGKTGLKRRYARSPEFAAIMADLFSDLADCGVKATGELLSQCGNWVYRIDLSSKSQYSWDMLNDIFAANLLFRPEHSGTVPKGLDELTVEELGQGVWSHLGSGSTQHMKESCAAKRTNTGSKPSRTRNVSFLPSREEIDRPESVSGGERPVVRLFENDDSYGKRCRAESRFEDDE